MPLPSPRRLLAVASTALALSATAYGTTIDAQDRPAGAGIVAPLASAVLNCETDNSFILCGLGFLSPPVGTLTIRWTVNGTLRSAFNDQTDIIVGCGSGQRMNIVVVVTDACGTVRLTWSGICRDD